MLRLTNQVPDAAVTSGAMITLAGGIFGMQFDALALGFAAGVAVMSVQENQTFIKMIAGVFLSTLLAGALAPLAAAAAVYYVKFIAEAGLPAARMASAVIIGLAAQTVVPALLNRAKEVISSVKLGGQ